MNPKYLDYVCKLNKIIYGLKQASVAWFLKLSGCLVDWDSGSSNIVTFIMNYNHAIFFVVFLIYVDDILITGNDNQFIQQLICKFNTTFTLKDLSELSFFLGI